MERAPGEAVVDCGREVRALVAAGGGDGGAAVACRRRVRGSRGGRRRGGSGKGIRVWIGEGCERRLGVDG